MTESNTKEYRSGGVWWPTLKLMKLHLLPGQDPHGIAEAIESELNDDHRTGEGKYTVTYEADE